MVVIDVESFGTLKVGIIQSIIVDGNKVLFVCESFLSMLGADGIYSNTEKLGVTTVDINKLADHQPLRRIGSLSSFSFVLHHFISDYQV